MNGSRKLLIFGGVVLAAFGMLYGLHYALFVEHQTLGEMGGSLMEAFVQTSTRHLPRAHASIDAYAATKFKYVRQVDVHSHWIGLAMLMIVLGVAFDGVAFEERTRFLIALGLCVGAVLFPLGVILQTVQPVRFIASTLAIAGSVTVTAALAAAAWGFAAQG